MSYPRQGQVAVIFLSQRTREDAEGYAAAAEAMATLAATQPGYAGIESVRDETGLGVTISYWADDASAAAWRDNPEHARIRDLGRARWYDWYVLEVTRVERGYRWARR
ncbi:antibiotic biosynthesis monooxygenase [Sphingomonas sp. BT-65]|uniref:antibiotic biosynthesis monooxygenase n=1 Tax=Sphingomonas sp. BT-65 TaxID=2989821 RepID=UPI0022358B13|nr:antibiotic biosynthesis monooxygenase [Sphingomonas sp. BT-65]MCW4462420.1 antibiotic biosynthesis monooxygenase [Sphingomonas sp. BT-65]